MIKFSQRPDEKGIKTSSLPVSSPCLVVQPKTRLKGDQDARMSSFNSEKLRFSRRPDEKGIKTGGRRGRTVFDLVELATVAIAAMREPTEKMLDGFPSDIDGRSTAEAIWTAMIEQALDDSDLPNEREGSKKMAERFLRLPQVEVCWPEKVRDL